MYACKGVFKICDDNKWKYLFRFKEGRIKSIAEEFQSIKDFETTTKSTNPFWLNDINLIMKEPLIWLNMKKQKMKK